MVTVGAWRGERKSGGAVRAGGSEQRAGGCRRRRRVRRRDKGARIGALAVVAKALGGRGWERAAGWWHIDDKRGDDECEDARRRGGRTAAVDASMQSQLARLRVVGAAAKAGV